MNRSRDYLVELVRGLGAFDVDVQVAMFEDGPLRPLLEEVADVRVLSPLPPRSAGGLLQSAARRVSPGLADRVHDLRAAADRRWIRPPDGIFVHGPLAAPVLRYERSAVPVTTYCHPWDFSIAGLPPLDLTRLLDRTDRFLVADSDTFGGAVVEDLVAAGVDPASIHTAPDTLEFPPSTSGRAAIRRRIGIGIDDVVVAVPPVADWVDSPDLTLSLVWELERLSGDRRPVVLWYGMPAGGDRRWPIDYDAERMGISSLLISDDVPSWGEVVAAVDACVLPIRATSALPERAVETAVSRSTPVLCWEGHELAGDVQRLGGAVVPRGDVSAMASRVWSMIEGEEPLRRTPPMEWRPLLDDFERVAPIRIQAPRP